MPGTSFRKLLSFMLTLVGVSVILFLVGFAAPNAETGLVDPRATPEVIARIRTQYGLDQPLSVQYVLWIEHTLEGDWGTSLRYRQPVFDVIISRLPSTLELAFLSLITSGVLLALLALPRRSGGAFARWLQTVFMAMPSFVLALLLIVVLGLSLRLLPLAGRCDPRLDTSACSFLSSPQYLVMPLIVLTVALVGGAARETLRDDESAGGVIERVLQGWRAALPIFVGALIVVEILFALPGIGRTVLDSAVSRDQPLLIGCVAFLTFAAIAVHALLSLLIPTEPEIGRSTNQPLPPRGGSSMWDTSDQRFALAMWQFTGRQAAAAVPRGSSLDRLRKLSGKPPLIPTRQPQPVPPLIRSTPSRQRRVSQDGGIPLTWIVLIFIALLAIFAPFISDQVVNLDPYQMTLEDRLLPPGSPGHPFGTDDLGRDLLARLLYGGQTSLGIAFFGGVGAVIIGVLLSRFDGAAGRAVNWLASTVRVIPALLLLLFVSGTYSGMDVATLTAVLAVIAAADVFWWLRRLTGGLKPADDSSWVPALMPLLLQSMASILLLETTLSFLGMGILPPTPSWGALLTNAMSIMRAAPEQITLVGIPLFITLFCLYRGGKYGEL